MTLTTYGKYHRRGNNVRVTPWSIFKIYDSQHHFTIDACADRTTTRCRRFISPETNALKTRWPYGSVAWLNPPFAGLYAWVKKAFLSSQQDYCTVVCLIPAWTNERWYHEFCSRAAQIVFLRDEVHFINADGSVNDGGFPHGMMVVTFRPGTHQPQFRFAHHAMKD
jgi:phage N-6-adenine-methyltransferase